MPYKSDKQRRFMHARHPEIAAKWDAEIRRKKKVAKADKPVMSDTELRRRKKLQGQISRTTSTLGLTGVGLLGTSLALKKKPGMFKAVPGLKKANPDKLREGAQNIGLVSGGIGGIGGYNFAAYTNAESRKRKQGVMKSLDGPEMDGTYGAVGFAKNWQPVARNYNPESKRQKRAESYPKIAAAASGATGAAAAGAALSGYDKITDAKAIRAQNVASGARKAYKPLHALGMKRMKTAGKLGAVSATAAGGAAILHHKKKSDDWASYAKSAASAFGVTHD